MRTRMPRLAAIIAALFVCAGAAPAALPPPAKRLPPAGIELPDAERAELTAAAAALRADLEATARELAPAPGLAASPDEVAGSE